MPTGVDVAAAAAAVVAAGATLRAAGRQTGNISIMRRAQQRPSQSITAGLIPKATLLCVNDQHGQASPWHEAEGSELTNGGRRREHGKEREGAQEGAVARHRHGRGAAV